MFRSDALGYLSARLDAAYTQAQRTTDDTATGYGPAIDAAMVRLGAPVSDVLSYEVPDGQTLPFTAALRYEAWDLVLNDLAMIVDQQVDAPLTNVKASQAYKNAKERRDEALADLAVFGLGPSNTNWIKWNLDFLEPSTGTTNRWEWGV